MDVACSTFCFSNEPLERALRHIAELEFSKFDLGIAPNSLHVTPEEVIADVSHVVQRLRQGPTLAVVAITARLTSTGAQLEAELDAIGRLGATLSAPIIVIESAPSGSSLDDEVKRLERLHRILSAHGCILTLTTKTGTLTEDPAVAVTLCEKVRGIGLTLDPSHYVCGPWQGKLYDQVFPHVRHVHLRDTGRRMDQLQVMVGRGEIEYGRIATMLGRYSYRGSLTVDVEENFTSVEMDIEAEVRKLRLVLESLL